MKINKKWKWYVVKSDVGVSEYDTLAEADEAYKKACEARPDGYLEIHQIEVMRQQVRDLDRVQCGKAHRKEVHETHDWKVYEQDLPETIRVLCSGYSENE